MTPRTRTAAITAVVVLAAAALVPLVLMHGDAAAAHRRAATSVPPPPPGVCGQSSLDGPSAAPAGAVKVPAGDNSNQSLDKPTTTYWFAPGTHTFGTTQYGQLIPGTNDTYMGAPGAVLNGKGVNNSAIDGHATGVTVEYLTVENFGSTKTHNNQNQGVVNHTSATAWTITHDTVEDNQGAGVMLGSTDTLSDDCLTKNGQYGFSAYSTSGTVHNLAVTGNEISSNDTYDWTAKVSGCGCSGGAKFWETEDAVVTGNFVHTNKNVGLWVDTDNRGFDIADNYFSKNSAEALIYEISYNAVIVDNIFVDNDWVDGPKLGKQGFPDPSVYVSESGGDSRVASAEEGEFEIERNQFVDNWGGVVLWENSNRYCGDGSDSAGCTLVTPSTYTIKSCKAHLKGSKPSQTPDYYDNCRWKTKTVTVSHNEFTFTPKAIGSSCTDADYCGYNGLFSEYGTTTPWKGWQVPRHISDDQNDTFSDNAYVGPWHFDGFAQGLKLTWSEWRRGIANADYSSDPFQGQDGGSTYKS